jgi:hypothetical protein
LRGVFVKLIVDRPRGQCLSGPIMSVKSAVRRQSRQGVKWRSFPSPIDDRQQPMHPILQQPASTPFVQYMKGSKSSVQVEVIQSLGEVFR